MTNRNDSVKLYINIETKGVYSMRNQLIIS